MLRIIAIWVLICIAIGIFSGISSAIFLVGLDWVSGIRDTNKWVIYLLPVGGLFIGWAYSKSPENSKKGNNAIITEYHHSQTTLPFITVPLVFISTLITHLLGGSAGREGTAVQMSAAIADQLSEFKFLRITNRNLFIKLGIAGGFAGVFGTPFAAAFFAIEILLKEKFYWKFILPTFFTAWIAHLSCITFFPVHHSEYHIFSMPPMSLINIAKIFIASVLFGLTSRFFVISAKLFTKIGIFFTQNAIIKPVIAGFILIFVYLLFPCEPFYGLSLKGIEQSFFIISRDSDFLIKLLLTTLTLSFGFKGGEVTPLFFIGATLGSAISGYFGIPTDFMAGLGFIAVFASATHTPIASTIMGIELFGLEFTFYFLVVSLIAHFVSGKEGIYSAQMSWTQKIKFENFFSRKVQDSL